MAETKLFHTWTRRDAFGLAGLAAAGALGCSARPTLRTRFALRTLSASASSWT